MNSTLYWIHDDTMTDPSTEGYIGITSQSLRRRFTQHTFKRPQWHNMKIKALVVGSRRYIIGLEKKLRPCSNIGLNEASGGGDPPNHKGVPKSKEFKEYMSEVMKKPKTKIDLINKNKQRMFLCVDPQGTEYVINGLRAFCVEHGLHQGCMSNVSTGILKHHKGWTCKKVAE